MLWNRSIKLFIVVKILPRLEAAGWHVRPQILVDLRWVVNLRGSYWFKLWSVMIRSCASREILISLTWDAFLRRSLLISHSTKISVIFGICECVVSLVDNCAVKLYHTFVNLLVFFHVAIYILASNLILLRFNPG